VESSSSKPSDRCCKTILVNPLTRWTLNRTGVPQSQQRQKGGSAVYPKTRLAHKSGRGRGPHAPVHFSGTTHSLVLRYSYYLHGPLRRTLGSGRLQYDVPVRRT
jgi:hypothetical protein